MPVQGCLAGLRWRSVRAGLIVLFAAAASFAQSESPADSVSIKTGDEVWVMFTQEGSLLTKPVALPASPGEAAVVQIKLERSGTMRTLWVVNGFSQPLTCRARIRFRGRAEQLENDIGPVSAGQENVMTFANPVDEITLFEFRLLQ